LGGLYPLPPAPAPFSFPEIFQSYSGSTPTIGKTFPGNSTSSTASTATCPYSVLGLTAAPSVNLTKTGPLNVSNANAAPTQGKVLPA
jgi:hypothetical protein